MTAGIATLPNGNFTKDIFAGAIIVRAHEPAESLVALRDRRCVVNEADCNILETLIRAALEAPADMCNRFFGSVHLSGSHRQSVEMVAGYEADVAAVDSSTLAQLKGLYPALLDKVRVLCWTTQTR
jgi:ABC-type phosphate/phosphonate transport system substrate-binding protein